MNFDITYTKYNNDGTQKSKYFVFEFYNREKKYVVKYIFNKLNELINGKYFKLPGSFTISKDELIYSFKNIEVIIKSFNSDFDFNIFLDEIYKNFKEKG